MIARPIESNERESYDALARKHGSVFHTLAWGDLAGESLIRCGIFDKGENLVGGFHLYKEKKFGITLFRNPPFTPECGPFFEARARNTVAALEERRDVLDAMAVFLSSNHFSVRCISLSPEWSDGLPFYWRKYKVIPHYTYRLDLAKSRIDLQAGLCPKRRNDISRATRDGVTASLEGDYRLVRDLSSSALKRSGKDPRIRYLDAILFQFASPTNSYAFTAQNGDRPLATCFVIHDSTVAYNLLTGHVGEGAHRGGGAIAHWQAILHAQELGLRIFDFEGSIIPPIESFFRGFGGTLTHYFTVNRAPLAAEMVLKLFHREMF